MSCRKWHPSLLIKIASKSRNKVAANKCWFTVTCDVSEYKSMLQNMSMDVFLKFFIIIAFLDEETQRLNLLERKIRRPRLASSDAEEISEDLDVSHRNNTLQKSPMLYYGSRCQHSPIENISYAQYL